MHYRVPGYSVEWCTTTNPYTNRRVVALVILVLFRFLLKHGYTMPLNCVVADSGLFRTSINPRWWLAANPTAAFSCLESSFLGLCTYLRYDCRWIDGECPGKRHRMWANEYISASGVTTWGSSRTLLLPFTLSKKIRLLTFWYRPSSSESICTFSLPITMHIFCCTLLDHL